MGRYLGPRITTRGLVGQALTARLESQGELAAELAALQPREPVTFIHLAARVAAPACEADPTAAQHINVELAAETARRVFDWASDRSLSVKLIYVSSGHV